MKFERYTDSSNFLNDTRDILVEHEAQNMYVLNGLRLDIKTGRDSYEKLFAERGWEDEDGFLAKLDAIFWSHPQKLYATVKDSGDNVLLVAYCTYPYKRMTLFSTRNDVNAEAVKLFADELKAHEFIVRKVRAEHDLATCFAKAYGGDFTKHSTMNLMQAEKVIEPPRAKGSCRPIEEKDMFFVPFWEAECLKACNQEPTTLEKLHESYSYDIKEQSGFLWEDGFPVSQAFVSVSTENGAIIGDVYTPPFYRKKGYATSLVAELSRIILSERGKRFCALFADADNPAACEMYRKIGYGKMCVVDEIIKKQGEI